MRRALHNSFGINSFRTLSIATGVYPPPAASHSLKSRLGRRWRRIDGLASAFLERVNCIDRQVFKAFDQAAGPADLDPIDLGGGAEAEVDAHVVIGDVAGTTANFIDERSRAGFHRDLRTDAVAIGFAADGVKRYPVIAIVNVVHQQHRWRVHVADHRGHAAVIPQIAGRQPARRTYRRNPGPGIGGNIGERSVAFVVIQNLRLFEIAAKVLAVHFGINVAIDEQQIGPAVVVHIDERHAPAEILRVQSESGGKGLVVKCAVAIVPVERGSIVGKIGFEKIQPAVAVIVADRGAHSGLLAPVIIKRGARNNGDVGERAVVVVVVEDAGSAVARDVYVRPAVVVIVECGNTEGVMPVGLIDVRFRRNVFKHAVAKIVIEDIFRPRQAARAAHDGNTLPHAGRPLARRKSGGRIKVDVVGHDQIELAVAIIVDEGAARAPGFAAARDMRFFADVGERAIAIVVVENVFAVVRNIQIFEAVVVVIAHAHALTPTGVGQAGSCGDIGERAVVIVAVEVACRSFARWQGFQRRAVDDENVGPAVIVVIKDGNTGPRSLDDVFLRVFAAENDRCSKSGFLGDVGKMRDRPGVCALGIAGAYARRTGGLC